MLSLYTRRYDTHAMHSMKVDFVSHARAAPELLRGGRPLGNSEAIVGHAMAMEVAETEAREEQERQRAFLRQQEELQQQMLREEEARAQAELAKMLELERQQRQQQ